MLEAMKAVKLMSVTNTVEAELIMNLLRNNEIPCFKKDNFTGSYMNIYMGYTVFGEVIYVDEADYERAQAIINELKPEIDSASEKQSADLPYDEDTSEDNYTYQQVAFYRNPRIVARILLGLMVGGILLSILLNYIYG